MNEFDFVIQYKNGKEMPADFLSRNVLAAIDIFNAQLPQLQQQDQFANALLKFSTHLSTYQLTQHKPLTFAALHQHVSSKMTYYGVVYNAMTCHLDQ